MGAYENQAMEEGPAGKRRRKRTLRIYSVIIRLVTIMGMVGGTGVAMWYISDLTVRTAALAAVVLAGILISHFCALVSRENR